MPAPFGPLLYVLAFVTVVATVQMISSLVFTASDRNKAVNRRVSMLQSGLDHDQVYSALVRRARPPMIGGPQLHRLFDALDAYCHQAGLSMSPLRILAVTASVAGAIWLLGLTVIGATGQGLFLYGTLSLIASAGLAVLGVWFWITNKRAARLKKIEEQLPLALDVVNRAIRAGHPVVSAVQLAANEMGDPLGSEFGLIVDETTYGAEFKDALVNFAHRTGSSDAHFFAVSVSIQSETGGNLAEILEGLATVIRGRTTLGKRVRALASEGKASAYLLSALPPAVVGFQMATNPKFYVDKFSDPIFWPIVGGVLALYLLGWVMIHRIINFKY